MNLRIILWLALLTCSAMCAADTVNPYFARVEVSDAGEAARQAAFDRALAQVLIKLSGRDDLVRSLSPGGASRYVQQYRYLDQEDADDDNEAGGDSGQVLEVHFDANAIQRLSVELDLPVWPLERGETAVWVAIETGGRRRLLGTETDDQELKRALERAARRRAMPVILPLLDLEDQGRVSVGDVWGGFSEPLRRASDRYGAVYQMFGRLTPAGLSWEGRWILDVGQQRLRWEDRGETPEAVLESGIEGAASRLASRMSVRSEIGEGAIELRVVGVESPMAYGHLTTYLRSLSVVRSLTLTGVEGGAVHFRVDAFGGPASLAQVLTLGDLLQPEHDDASTERLRYRLNERAVPR